MRMVRYKLSPDQPLTQEQIERIRRAKQFPVVPDEDCPALTREQLAKARRVSDKLKERKS